MTWRGLRKSPSSTSFSPPQSSFARSADCEVEEVPRITTSNISRPSLSRPSSPRSKGDNQTEKAGSIHHYKSFSAIGNPKPPTTLWSTGDSYLPRAKPPPPLKGIQHQRNRSEYSKRPANLPTSRPSTSCQKAPQGPVPLSIESPSVPSYSDLPVLDISSQYSSTSHRTTPQSASSSLDLGSRQSSLPHSPTLHSFPSSPHLPVLDISREHSDDLAIQPEPETRFSRTSTASDGSDETGISFAPTKHVYGWKWRPPSSWNGPSKAKRVGEEDKLKQAATWPFSRKKSVDTSSQRDNVQSQRDLSRVQSLKELRSIELANVEKSGGPILGSAAPSSGVTVKIKCFQKREWEEKPIAEVIPLLRELRVE